MNKSHDKGKFEKMKAWVWKKKENLKEGRESCTAEEKILGTNSIKYPIHRICF